MVTNSAMVIGRQHRLLQQNGQDYALAGETPGGNCFGLVADGCGSKFRFDDQSYASQNEVGSKLLCRFAAGWLEAELDAAGELAPIIERLYASCLDFLQRLACSVSNAGDRAGTTQFIATHLLTTLLGFAVTDKEAVFFWLGDGFLCHDGEVHSLLSHDGPDYPAYRLLEDTMPADTPKAGFHIRKLERSGLQQLAAATDGWTPALLTGLEPAPAGLTLQRWMNIQARRPAQFDDDGAIALCVLR